jgi:hypothetical protein
MYYQEIDRSYEKGILIDKEMRSKTTHHRDTVANSISAYIRSIVACEERNSKSMAGKEL